MSRFWRKADLVLEGAEGRLMTQLGHSHVVTRTTRQLPDKCAVKNRFTPLKAADTLDLFDLGDDRLVILAGQDLLSIIVEFLGCAVLVIGAENVDYGDDRHR